MLKVILNVLYGYSVRSINIWFVNSDPELCQTEERSKDDKEEHECAQELNDRSHPGALTRCTAAGHHPDESVNAS